MGGRLQPDKIGNSIGGIAARNGATHTAAQSNSKFFMAGYNANPETMAKKKQASLDAQTPLTSKQSQTLTGRSSLLG